MNAMFKLTTRILVGQTRHLQIPMELLTHNPSVELLKISPGYSEKKRGPTLGSQNIRFLMFSRYFAKSLQCGAPKIAKLVYTSNNYGLWY